MSDDLYEIFAIRYATMAERTRRETFLSVDPHDAAPCPIDYFVWVVRNAARTIVVDTGFDEAEGRARGRRIDCLPRDALARIGVDASTVADVVITHLHYDHAGTIPHFPAARFHLQEAELAYTTGRCMAYAALRQPYSVDHVCQVVRHIFAGRITFHSGDSELAPGISLHLIGGHAKGIQAVRVNTARGQVVLASDAAHYFENLLEYRPFIIVHDVEATLRGYDRLRQLASSVNHIIPGHDPQVLRRYPNLEGEAGVIARLDLPSPPS